jgi:hypothetical protein
MGADGIILDVEICWVFGSSCLRNLARLLENHTYRKQWKFSIIHLCLTAETPSLLADETANPNGELWPNLTLKNSTKIVIFLPVSSLQKVWFFELTLLWYKRLDNVFSGKLSPTLRADWTKILFVIVAVFAWVWGARRGMAFPRWSRHSNWSLQWTKWRFVRWNL